MTSRFDHWRKSSHSAPNGDCVEVGRSADGVIGVRDSKAREAGPTLEFTVQEWSALLHNLRSATH